MTCLPVSGMQPGINDPITIPIIYFLNAMTADILTSSLMLTEEELRIAWLAVFCDAFERARARLDIS